ALAQGHAQPRVALLSALAGSGGDARYLARAGAAVRQGEARPQLGELRLDRLAGDLDQVFLGTSGRGMRDQPGELAVVGQQEQALGLDVQSAHGLNSAAQLARYQV